MIRIPKIFSSTASYVIKHSPEVLTILNATGVVVTTILAAKEGAIAKERLDDLERNYDILYQDGKVDSYEIPTKEKLKTVLPIFIPTFIMGATTITCGIASNRISSNRNAVIASLYSASEIAAKEYHDKVVEMLGERKEKEIRDKIAEDHIRSHPVASSQVVVLGDGDHLCYDDWTGRYFRSNYDKIRRVGNWAIDELKVELFLTLNELYSELGLENVGNGNYSGWDCDHVSMHEDFFRFSSQIADNGEPCLVISFNEEPMAKLY